MKRLYIVRHAKSSWDDSGLADFDRPLASRGERDAPEMGKRLAKKDAKPNLLISSPACRALTTAKIIAKEVNYPEKDIVKHDEIYMGGIVELLRTVQNIDPAIDEAMIFGHNPDFTMFAEYLTNTRFGNIPTCGVVCLDLPTWEEADKGRGTLVYYDYPKNKHI